MSFRPKPLLGKRLNTAHPLARGLVGCWLMNEGGGNAVYDLSGQGNNGVLTNGPVWVPGRTGCALDFDGVDDYVNISLSTHFTQTTWSVWMKAEAGYGETPPRLFDKREAGAETILCFIDATNNRIYFSRVFSTDYGEWHSPTNSISVGIWYHVVVVYDDSSADNDPYIYINGVNQTITETNAPIGTANTNTDNYLIGNRGATDRSFKGILDDFRISDCLLSASEVAQLCREPYAMFEDPYPIELMGYVAAAETFTVTHSIDTLLQKVGLTNTSLLDALLSKSVPITLSIDSVLKTIGALKTASIDTLLSQLGLTATATMDALLSQSSMVNVSIDTVLKALGVTATTSLDALLKQTGLTITASLDTLLQKASTATVSVDALLKALGVTATTSLDTLLQQTGLTTTVSLDTLLQKTSTSATSMDALLKALDVTSTISIDALLEILGVTSTASIDTLLQKVGTITISIDALLKALGKTATTSPIRYPLL